MWHLLEQREVECLACRQAAAVPGPLPRPARPRVPIRPVFPRLVKTKKNLTQGPHRYDRYGFRVPAVIVSPYARPDYVCSEVLDHTSVLRLVEEKWNLPALTARNAW